MKFVIQRVNHAKCTIDGKITGSIEKGLCVLIGVAETDTKEIADKMIKKLVNMRIFADENDKTNLSINDVNGKLLLISQFTLYANCKRATVLRLWRQESLIWLTGCMSTASANVKRWFRACREAYSELI